MQKESRIALRVETCLHEAFGAAAEKKGLNFQDGIRKAMALFVRKYTPSVVSKLEKGLEAAKSLNKKRGRRTGTRFVNGKLIDAKEARRLEKAGKLKPAGERKAKKEKKVAKIASLKKNKKAEKSVKKSVNLL